MHRISSDWHSPLASSLPYMSSVSSYSERGVIMSLGMSPVTYDDRDELQYPFDDEIASSTEHIETDTEIEHEMKPSRLIYETNQHIKPTSSKHVKQASYKHVKQASITSTTSSSDDSDADIDEIRRAIDKTLGSKEDDDTQQQHINPRAKYLAQLGIGKKLPLAAISQKSSPSQTSSRTTPRTPRTPPTSPVTDSNDDSLDAMLALMGVSDEMIAPVTRSSPIDIPRRVSRPIPIPTRQSRPISRPMMPMIPQTSHKYDSDDEIESYFDSPQSEDLSGSMLFDY